MWLIALLRNSEVVSMSEAEWIKGKVVGGDVRGI